MTLQIQLESFSTDKAIFSQILKSVQSLDLEECTLEIKNDGIYYRSMDASHVALCDMYISNSCFETWDIQQEQKIAFRTDELLKLVKTLDAKGRIKVVITRDFIEIHQNGFAAKVSRIEESATDCPLPKIAYNSEFSLDKTMLNADFVKLTKKIESVSDYITIHTEDNFVKFSGKGDNGSSEIIVDQEQISINNHEDSETTFSLEYVIGFLKSVTKETKLNLSYSTRHPLRIKASIMNGYGRIDFYLAPRIEN